MMSTTFFECPYYHEFRQLLEQSVQDTLLTGRKFVAANLSVSLLLAPYLGSDTGQADRQTDGQTSHHCIMLPTLRQLGIIMCHCYCTGALSSIFAIGYIAARPARAA